MIGKYEADHAPGRAADLIGPIDPVDIERLSAQLFRPPFWLYFSRCGSGRDHVP
jgi:hypothetical protein